MWIVQTLYKLIGQLVRSHLEYLNKQYELASPFALLYRCFFYDASPYTNK